LASPVQTLPTSMTSLPIALPEPAHAHAGRAFASIGQSCAEDEQFLLRAFRSFSAAAAALEDSYSSLRGEVERLRHELEESNRDLASSLAHEQALAEVSAVLAHEIRNPLASLEWFAGLLADSVLSAECQQWVEHMQAGLRTLAAAVNNVLHFYSHPVRAALDLGELLDWAHDFLPPLARQAEIPFSLENPLAGIVLPADRHRLQQVLLNLLKACAAWPESRSPWPLRWCCVPLRRATT